jgi:DNA-binding CsgD family transcriptional regulator/cbb3-type cytochrome oxidase subunit 3
MRISLFFFLYLFYAHGHLWAQNEIEFNDSEYLALSKKERTEYINTLVRKPVNDIHSKGEVLIQIGELSESQNDIQNYILSVINLPFIFSDSSLQKKIGHNRITLAEKIIPLSIELEMEPERIITSYYWRVSKNQTNSDVETYKNIRQSIKDIKAVPINDFKNYCLSCICINMLDFLQRIENDKLTFEALSIAEKSIHDLSYQLHAYVLVQSHFQAYWKSKGEFEKAFHHNQKIIDVLSQDTIDLTIYTQKWIDFWVSFSQMHQVEYLVSQNKAQKAQEYLEKGIQMFLKLQEDSNADSQYLLAEFDAIQLLIPILSKQKNYPLETKLIQRTTEIIPSLKKVDLYTDERKLTSYKNFQLYYEDSGNLEKALITTKQLDSLNIWYTKKYNTHKYELIKKNEEFEAQSQELSSEKKDRWFYIILSIVLFIGIGIWLYVYRITKKAHSKKEKISEIKLHRAINHLQKKEDANLKQEAEIEWLKNKSAIQEEEKNRLSKIEKLKKQSILTKEDWQEFKTKFAVLFPKMTQEIEQKYPKTTQAEKRLLMLEYLGFSTEEIAVKVGVNKNTIYQTKRRFKNKYAFSSDVNVIN